MDLSQDLIESDRSYFERGARLVGLPGAVLAHMPTFRDIPAAAVVHRVDPGAVLPDPLTWIVTVETIATDLGLPRSRFLLDRSTPELELALTMLGYQSRAEYGLLRPAAPVETRVQLVPIRDDTDWSRKLGVHAPTENGPDGFALDPHRWVTFEQAKQAAGYFTLYLAMQEGVPCGSFGVNCTGKLLRLKNLVVAPTHRRRGIGAAILDAVSNMAHSRGLAAVGCFSLPGGQGDPFYRAMGFHEAIVQVGWDRTLNLPVPARLARRRVHAYS